MMTPLGMRVSSVVPTDKTFKTQLIFALKKGIKPMCPLPQRPALGFQVQTAAIPVQLQVFLGAFKIKERNATES